jgi:peptidoglycan/LPS O-acetylase OafA/YrhL
VVIFHLNTAFSKEIGFGSDLGIVELGGKQNFLQLGWWVIRLDLGVKVFFAISGFVLALPFLKQHFQEDAKKIVLKEYYIRRLTRLEPPFVVSLILFTLVHMYFMKASWDSIAEHFWAGLLYSHVFIFGAPNPINPVTWSLETEAQFYVLVPLIFAGLFSITGNAGKIATGIAVFMASVFLKGYLLKNNLSHLSESILAYMSNFTTGIAFACLFLLDKKNRLKSRSIAWDIAGLLSIFMIFYFYKPQALWSNNILFNTGIFILMVAAFKGNFTNRFFTNKFIYTIGGMCYSIYLLHYAFLHLFVKYTSGLSTGMGYKMDLGLQLCIALPVILIISGVFFLMIEKPCMNKRWPHQIARIFKS